MNTLTQEVLDVALTLMEGLDCPRSLTVAILLRSGEWDQLTSLEVDPKHHCDDRDYFEAIAATDLLRKYDGFKLDVNPREVAIEKWWWSEKQCYITNERLGKYLNRGSSPTDLSDARILDFIDRVRKNVLSILGDRPPETWEGRFGPGATVSDVSRMSTIPDKMSSVPSLTPNALFHLVPWTGTKWAEASAALGRSPIVVKGNHYFTVKKSSRTDRSCAKEPSLNGFYQLGLGRVMRDRLKQWGINLTTGQDVHRRVACTASRDGSSATIDLTSASDTVCTNLVKLVIPPRWAAALESLRSPFTFLDGKWIRLEKFSSMGNGYTFELETVLFSAIALAAAPGSTPGVDLHVYGDDIIVKSPFANDVVWALKFFGFFPNQKKTFLEGPFRESCGGDFWDGMAVRPVYLESDPNEPHKLISLANSIARLRHQDGCRRARHNLRRAWFRVLDLIPAAIRRCRGPQALGDLVIHDVEQRWETRVRSSIRYVRVYRPAKYREVRWDGFAYDVQFATALYGVYLHQPEGRGRRSPDGDPRVLHPRDSVTGYKVGWVPYS